MTRLRDSQYTARRIRGWYEIITILDDSIRINSNRLVFRKLVLETVDSLDRKNKGKTIIRGW